VRSSVSGALREAVREGRLLPGTTLPPIRRLAEDLGVSRNTVTEAYAELVAEGWLVARQGSGTRVAERVRATLPPPRRQVASPPTHPFNLFPGSPDVSSFPRNAWISSVRRAVSAAPNEAFGPGDARGRPELRRALAEYLARARGVRADPEHIVVSAGTTPALQLLGAALTGLTAVEAYGLPVHREQFAGSIPLALDDHGADISALAASEAQNVLLTSAHQFPTGGPLHASRRTEVVNWARTNGGLVLEDDYDGEFRYDREPVGAVQGLDPQHVVYLGSTSKSLSPALRLGWMVLPHPVLDKVLAEKGEHEHWVNTLDQLALADFIESGSYDRHIRRMRLRYRKRRDQLLRMLEGLAPHVAVSGIAAGLHVVLRLPAGTEAEALRQADYEGIALAGLGYFRHPDSPMPPQDGLVVSYGTPSESAAAATFTALGRALAFLR